MPNLSFTDRIAIEQSIRLEYDRNRKLAVATARERQALRKLEWQRTRERHEARNLKGRAS